MKLKRKEIKEMLPEDVSFSLKKVPFTDLARGEAKQLHVYRNGTEIYPCSIVPEEFLESHKDIFRAVNRIRGNYYGVAVII